ncbi:MAG TPA: hypothetical protein PKA64_02795, partial [Myxococcota bacterium]|nr:hypothetical protein [Myxococcota bacterium]
MARVFVVWDSRLRDVGVTMKALRGAPDRVGGHHVDILGAPGDERIGVIDANLRERVAACDGILAYVDHPNANMAWELGRGLGLRREGPRVRATLATQSSQHGGWVRDTLLDGVLQQVDGSRRQVVRRLLDNLDAWIALAPPEPGDRTVVLCPDGGSGELLREGIEGARLGGVLRLDDVRLLDLPDRLRGVGRCAWVLPPQRDDDPGHGVENTIHALIAGYLDAAGVPLRVFTHHDAPVVADLSGRHARWDDEEELLHHLDAWLTTTRPLGSADRRTPSDVLALWRDLARERHAHTTPLLPERSDRTLDAVCVRVQVEARDSHEPRAPVGFRRDAAPLKELVEARLLLPGPVRAVVSGAPGSGKTTLARHLAWELAGEDRLPVYVPLAGLHGHPLDHADRELLDARAGASAGRLKEA